MTRRHEIEANGIKGKCGNATANAPEWPQDAIDNDLGLPLICPVTGAPCITEQDEFCEDYGCARRAGIDVDRDII